MNEPKKECIEIVELNGFGTGTYVVFEEVRNSGDKNGQGDQKFNHWAVHLYYFQRCQRQGNGVPDGKSGHQHQYSFPVAQ